MPEPEVSLIMPVWRPRPDWFVAAVQSALQERACSIELIVVDDGNSEPVEKHLRTVSDERLSMIRIEHAGPSGARNAGLAVARGRFVRFIDSDDIVVAGSTGRLFAAAAAPPAAIAHGGTAICDAQLRPTGRVIASSLEGDITLECVLGKFDTRIVSMLFPRTVLDVAGPFDTAFELNEDWDFVLRALEFGDARPVEGVATFYRRHGSSQQGGATIAKSEEVWHRILDKYLERHPELRRSRFAREARATIYLDRAPAYAARRQPLEATRVLIRGGRVLPGRAVKTTPRVARSVFGSILRQTEQARRQA